MGYGEDDVSAFFGGDVGSAPGDDAAGLAGDCADDEDQLELPMYVLALLLSGVEKNFEWARDNGRVWEGKLRRSDAYFYKRMRMSPASLHEVLKRVLPFLRAVRDGMVARPPSIEPRIRLLVVVFWRGQGGSQFTCCEVADIAESTLSPILRETVRALLCALPPPAFRETEVGQAAVAQRFVDNLDCRIEKVACSFIGPSAHRAPFATYQYSPKGTGKYSCVIHLPAPDRGKGI